MSMNTATRQRLMEGVFKSIYANSGRVNVSEIAKNFSITVQSVYKLLTALETGKVIYKRKVGRTNRYSFLPMKQINFQYGTNGLNEDLVLQKDVKPFLSDLSDNAMSVFSFVFTEMLNNAIDHSECPLVSVNVVDFTYFIRCHISDHGVGIFKKIQNSLNLDELRFAILELAKGKFTTDPKSHTGEGIFFSSKVSDLFLILSDGLAFYGANVDEAEAYLFGKESTTGCGTTVIFDVIKNKETTVEEIFQKYTQHPDDYGFSKTIVPVQLLEYQEENPIFVSRSQAKRLLVRFERFENIVLDFDHVAEIGQGFADEIFRVFQTQHPNSEIVYINANSKVERMIRHVTKKNTQ